MHDRNSLLALFNARYNLNSLVNVNATELREYVSRVVGNINSATEAYVDPEKQRDLSIKYRWGHNHKFSEDLNINGHMEDRHIWILSDFIQTYGLPSDLRGARVLDIGVWTGGTSLLLCALGADVTALEEVNKYSETVNYLANAFGCGDRLRCFPRSLYQVLPQFCDSFDYVLYSGVIYHVTDPVLSLRLIFSALRNNGTVFLETYGISGAESICRYEGPSIIHQGRKEELNRGGWNYFIPTSSCLDAWCRDAGFQESRIGPYNPSTLRIQGAATRKEFSDLCRAGLAQPHCR